MRTFAILYRSNAQSRALERSFCEQVFRIEFMVGYVFMMLEIKNAVKHFGWCLTF